jgi:hypothetical protein
MRAMYRDAKSGSRHSSRQLVRVHRFDNADYVGPVHLVKIPGRGRGLITTRSVPAGELLMAVKADDMQGIEEVSICTNCAQVMRRGACQQQ